MKSIGWCKIVELPTSFKEMKCIKIDMFNTIPNKFLTVLKKIELMGDETI